MIRAISALLMFLSMAVAADPVPVDLPPEGIQRHLSYLKHYEDDPNETLVVVHDLTNDLQDSVKQGTAKLRFGNTAALAESIRIIRSVADEYANDQTLNPQTRGRDIKSLCDAADELAAWQTALQQPAATGPAVKAPAGQNP